MRFRTALIWNGISQFGQSGINLLSTIILAHILTPDDFAIIGIVTIFIALSQMMVDSEMGGALLRKKRVTDTDYSTLFIYNLAVSVILYLLLYVTAPLIAGFYHIPALTEVIRVIAVTIIIHAFRVVQRVMIFRDLKFKAYAIINVVSGTVSLIAAVWLADKGYGYWALVWQQVVLAIANVILMECYNRFIPSLIFSIKSFRYQFSFGIGLILSAIVRTIATNISTNIIAKMASNEFTGYYTQVSRLTNFCQSTLNSIMDQCIFPMLAKYEKVEDIRKFYYRFLKLMTLGLLLATAVFVVFARPIISLILGDQWVGGTLMLQILSLTILPANVQVLCRNILKTLGETKKILYLESVKSILTILFLVGGIFISLYFVIWSLVVSQTLSCIIFMAMTKKEMRRSIGDTARLQPDFYEEDEEADNLNQPL